MRIQKGRNSTRVFIELLTKTMCLVLLTLKLEGKKASVCLCIYSTLSVSTHYPISWALACLLS